MDSNAKYSIIIPAKNGLPYLSYAVRSALAANSNQIEIVVSLDDTGDGSKEFLNSISDQRLRVVSPPRGLSMSEHWDFAQSHALGDWQIFLGQDDLMMTGYEFAFEELTKEASLNNLGVIVARRAYICWPPLKEPDLKSLQYWETAELRVRDSRKFAAQALLSEISYHSGPQMYTTTLVAKSVIETIRKTNSGKLILGHPQDAFLSASLLRASKDYLFSGRPFSWVGTSSNSAGLAIAKLGKEKVSQLGHSYAESIEKSTNLVYRSSADFRHGINARYFIDALTLVWPQVLREKPIGRRWFRIRFDAGIWSLASRSQRHDFGAQALMFFGSPELLSRALGVWFSFCREVKAEAMKLFAKCLMVFKGGGLSFTSLDFAEDSDTLFSHAMSIRTKFQIRERH